MAESTGRGLGVDPGDGGSPPWRIAEALAPLERALADAWRGAGDGEVLVRTDAGDEDAFPAALLLRSPDALLPLDRAAVGEARGRVLDVGAGAGAVALALQERGHDVTALEILSGAREIMAARGVADVRAGDVWTFAADETWDTVVALMNGVALAGTRHRLRPFLRRLAGFLAPGGTILLDSTDPGVDEEALELEYQLIYAGEAGAPFPQLLVAPAVLADAAASVGLASTVVADDGAGGYLARLTPRS